MKRSAIFRFQFGYQARRPSTWLLFAGLTVFVFLQIRENFLADALMDDFFINSPFIVAVVTVVSSLIWLLAAASVTGEIAARDVETGLHPLAYTLPLGKSDYLLGRFLAAFTLNAVILLATPTGILLSVYLPGMEAEAIGPLRPAAFLTAYAYLALPNAFVATAIQFSLATLSGRPRAGYLGSLLLFFASYGFSFLLALPLGQPDLAKLTDPLGVFVVISEMSRTWTPIEKSTRLITLEGTLLWNRLLWLGIGLGTLVLTHWRFRFQHRTAWSWGRRRKTRSTALAPLAEPRAKTIDLPQLQRTFDLVLALRQTLGLAWTSFRALARSAGGLVLLAVIPAIVFLGMAEMMQFSDVPRFARTVLVLESLTAPLTEFQTPLVLVPLLIVFLAGVLVWREREAGLGEISDAAPVPEGALFLGKFLGLGLLLVAYLTLLMAAGMLGQLRLGHRELQVGLYLQILFGLQLPDYLLFALLALAVQTLIPQKHVGHLAAVLAYVSIVLAPMFGLEHKLLIFGASPQWSYTEMRGFGPSLGPWLWFKLYWASVALFLGVVASLLRVRGRETGFRIRLRLARPRLTRLTRGTAAVAVALILGLGGFLFHNTNRLHPYRTEAQKTAQRAEYEHRYARYAKLPQPRLAGTQLHVEIHPRRRALQIRGTYRLVNDGTTGIDQVHLAPVPGLDTRDLTLDRPARLESADTKLGHHIFALETPLQPGDTLQLSFEVNFQPHGFSNEGVGLEIVENGTLLRNQDWLPGIGYQADREILNASDRRAAGLPPRPLIPSLDDPEVRQNTNAGRIDFEAVVGTDLDQTAVAPGTLRRTWTQGDRRYFDYATETPIGNEYALFSADYAVREARWNDVTLQIFHHPAHTAQLDRMMRSAQASLAYFTQQFGPYPFRQLKLVEHAGNGVGMHADAGLIHFSEGFTYFDPDANPRWIDLPFAVTAHEVAHQWWGAQLTPAPVEGVVVMSESLAVYSSMRVVEHALGPEHLQRYRRFMRLPYPYPPIPPGRPAVAGPGPVSGLSQGPLRAACAGRVHRRGAGPHRSSRTAENA